MTTATKQSLYINQNGMVCCIKHGGAMMGSAYAAAPERSSYVTSFDVWRRLSTGHVVDYVKVVGHEPKCEVC